MSKIRLGSLARLSTFIGYAARAMDPKRMVSVLALSAALAAVAAAPVGATFPGDNGRIVFESTRDGQTQIYSMSADGTNEVQLTDGELTLRPEGELIALIHHARTLGLVPVLMTHGDSFRHRPELLKR